MAFVGAWREHGGIAMQLQDYFGKVVRYVQADATFTSGNLAGGDRSYDGVGEIVFETYSDLEQANASASRAEIVLPHGRKIFGSPYPISLIVEEHAEWFDHLASAKLYTFVRRPNGSSREAFVGSWSAACKHWSTDPDIRGIIRSYSRDISIKPDTDFDGVEEITFDTITDARRAQAEPRWLVRSLALDAHLAVLTRQVMLLDRTLLS